MTGILLALGMAATFVAAIVVTASPLERKPDFAVRVVVSSAVLGLAFLCLRSFAGMLDADPADYASWTYYVSEFVTFLVMLLAMVGFTLVCYEANVWTALFCATAAYIAQNLSSEAGTQALNLVAGLFGPSVREPGSGLSMLLLALVTAATYALYHIAFVSRIRDQNLCVRNNRSSLFVALLAILVSIVLDLVVKYLEADGVTPRTVILVLSLMQLAANVFILWMEYELIFNRTLLVEMGALERTLSEGRRQYEVAKESIEAINVKCHDIRHQIRELGDGVRAVDAVTLEALAKDITIYDASIDTGNDAVNVILTEKLLLCGREGIRLSCIVDGSALAFMDPADIYALFGNALDNAIRAARDVTNPERRTISLGVRAASGMASVHCENYFEGHVTFSDGLPLTTKEDVANHGFGSKSMRLIARRYDGSLSMRTDGDVFILDVAMPQR